MKSRLAMVLLVLFSLAAPAAAQIEQVKIGVNGMT